jgi:F-type H+-transporting ATPase subunit a
VKYLLQRALLVAVLAIAICSQAYAGKEASGQKFDPVGLIMHHISDAHSWHIFKNERFELILPLPVILVHEGRMHLFLSNRFGHGEKVVSRGDAHFVLYHEKVYVTDASGTLSFDEFHHPVNKKPLDLSITKNVAGMWMSMVIILVLFISVARRYRKVMVKPRGAQSLVEPIILFVRDNIASDMIGKHKSTKYVPYLLTLFFFIWINNLLGLVPFFPGGANVTGNIAVTALLAIITMFITIFSANKGYWKHIVAPPGVPFWVTPFIVPVEIVGIFTKPFALMMRLFANITAGHIIILSLISILFVVKSYVFAPVSIILVLFMMMLELLVGFLQAFIFTMLTALFIGMAVHEDEH